MGKWEDLLALKIQEIRSAELEMSLWAMDSHLGFSVNVGSDETTLPP